MTSRGRSSSARSGSPRKKTMVYFRRERRLGASQVQLQKVSGNWTCSLPALGLQGSGTGGAPHRCPGRRPRSRRISGMLDTGLTAIGTTVSESVWSTRACVPDRWGSVSAKVGAGQGSSVLRLPPTRQGPLLRGWGCGEFSAVLLYGFTALGAVVPHGRAGPCVLPGRSRPWARHST